MFPAIIMGFASDARSCRAGGFVHGKIIRSSETDILMESVKFYFRKFLFDHARASVTRSIINNKYFSGQSAYSKGAPHAFQRSA